MTEDTILDSKAHGVSNQGLVFTSIKYTWKSLVIIKSYPNSSKQLLSLFGLIFDEVAWKESWISLFYLRVDMKIIRIAVVWGRICGCG